MLVATAHPFHTQRSIRVSVCLCPCVHVSHPFLSLSACAHGFFITGTIIIFIIVVIVLAMVTHARFFFFAQTGSVRIRSGIQKPRKHTMTMHDFLFFIPKWLDVDMAWN